MRAGIGGKAWRCLLSLADSGALALTLVWRRCLALRGASLRFVGLRGALLRFVGFVALRGLRGAAWPSSSFVGLRGLCCSYTSGLSKRLQVRWPLPFLDIAQLLQMLASRRNVLRLFARVYASYATAQPRYQAHRVPEYACPFVPATTSSSFQGFRGRCVCTSAYDTALFSRTGGIVCASAVLPESAVALSTLPWLRLRR